MRGFVGIGLSDNIEAAINEATVGVKTADLFVLIAPFSKAANAAEALSAKYPGVPIIGTTGLSIGKKSKEESQITVIAFAGVTVATGIIGDTNKSPINYIKDFEQDLKSMEFSPDNTVCISFMTGNEEKTVSTLNSVLAKHSIPLAGSTCYGTPLGEQASVIYNDKLCTKSCVYAFIKNNAGKIKVYKENMYEPLTEKPFYATLVDPNTKTLFQLNDRPAFEVYSEVTGIEKDDIVASMHTNPLGRMLGDDIYIASTLSLDMNGVMFNGKIINDNDSVHIMQLGDFREINSATKANIKENSSKISFVLSFDSIGRYKVFEEEDYVEDYINTMSSMGAYAGTISEGQQCNSQHMNQTLVLVVFE